MFLGRSKNVNFEYKTKRKEKKDLKLQQSHSAKFMQNETEKKAKVAQDKHIEHKNVENNVLPCCKV